MNSIARSGSAWALAALLLAALGGCQTARVAQPLTAELAGNQPSQQLEFWHTLATRPLTSNDEAFHGLLLYTDGQDPADSYEARVELLKSRKMLPANFRGQANEAVQRGTLAVAICRALEIKGGVMMRLSGAAPRYAVRELEFVELYPPSSTFQTFSGGEFVGIIGRMEDYQRGQAVKVPAAVLPPEIRSNDSPAPQ